MTLEELLRTAAQDVADAAPDTYVAPSRIRSRAVKARRRRGGLAAGLVAATAIVAVGLQIAGGSNQAWSRSGRPRRRRPRPTPVGPGMPVVEVPEITADDLREYEELATITNTQPGNEGLTELTFEVPVRDRYSYEWSHFCSGDPGIWYVVIVGDGGASGSGYCDHPAPQPFPSSPPTSPPRATAAARRPP